MDFIVINGTEWVYPDVKSYPSGDSSAKIFGARNSYCSFQVLFGEVAKNASVSVKPYGELRDFAIEYYELVPVYVEVIRETPGGKSPYIPTRSEPFYVYDCAKPLGANLTPHDGTAALYLAVKIPKDAKPGHYVGGFEVTVDDEIIKLETSMRIYPASIPEEEYLQIINGYSIHNVVEYHGVERNLPELAELSEKYLKMLRRMRQNMLYVSGVNRTKDDDGHYLFDFSALEKSVEYYLSLGYKYFNMSGVGGRKSWKESTILVAGMPAMSYEAYCYLADYLPALQTFLEEKGWIDIFYMGVADEPNDANATEFSALCGLVRKLAPKIRLIDALSYTYAHGALDVWVPLNSEYEKHKDEFDSYRLIGDKIWFYICCEPREEDYINRFIDYPLLSTRYLFWGNYLHNLEGYLHWATNAYRTGQDPFKQNSPETPNADRILILPPGDTHIVYPGEGEPWMSMRLEAQRQSAEDYELLRMISLKDKEKADSICRMGFRAFNDVEYDPVEFEKIRTALLEAASEL
ncbi:MAG: DUF4091 domain-containing protein [Clostridiaceae bacterium]|nr:DUF4091 domain-containing protein [Clostridiaceae bacterium]